MGAAVVVVGKGEGRERVHIPTQPFQSFPPGPLFMLSVILTFTCQHVASNSQLKLTSGAEQVDNNASKWVVKVNIKEYGSSITPNVINQFYLKIFCSGTFNPQFLFEKKLLKGCKDHKKGFKERLKFVKTLKSTVQCGFSKYLALFNRF